MENEIIDGIRLSSRDDGTIEIRPAKVHKHGMAHLHDAYRLIGCGTIDVTRVTLHGFQGNQTELLAICDDEYLLTHEPNVKDITVMRGAMSPIYGTVLLFAPERGPDGIDCRSLSAIEKLSVYANLYRINAEGATFDAVVAQ